jgi:hypothetical protein
MFVKVFDQLSTCFGAAIEGNANRSGSNGSIRRLKSHYEVGGEREEIHMTNANDGCDENVPNRKKAVRRQSQGFLRKSVCSKFVGSEGQ